MYNEGFDTDRNLVGVDKAPGPTDKQLEEANKEARRSHVVIVLICIGLWLLQFVFGVDWLGVN